MYTTRENSIARATGASPEKAVRGEKVTQQLSARILISIFLVLLSVSDVLAQAELEQEVSPNSLEERISPISAGRTASDDECSGRDDDDDDDHHDGDDGDHHDDDDDKAQCKDGRDNDSDGAADYPADFSCSSATDDDETNPKPQCQDGLDNDADGFTDLTDFSCGNDKQKNDESTPKAQCEDGIDNDGDGRVDGNDAGCTSGQDNTEEGEAECQDGRDNDGDGVADYPADFSCSSATDDDETNPKEDSDSEVPAVPTNLRASDGTSAAYVDVTWNAASRAETYQVYRSDAADESGSAMGNQVTGTSYRDTSAVPGVTYYYSVAAKNGAGESGYSNIDPGHRIQEGDADCDGDGISDEQEEIDDTDPCDRGSFQLHLRSPAFTKYNTFLRQWNFLELIASGSEAIAARVSVYLLDGRELVSQRVIVQPQTEFDVDVNAMIAGACQSSDRCSDLVDLDGNGVVDTYGLVRIDFNDKNPGETLIGRMSNYRLNPDGETYSFAFAKELRNPTKGITHATGNTFDPQALGYLVPNWLEIVNLDTKPQQFHYRLFSQEGLRVMGGTVTVQPLGEFDVQAGHEIGNAEGQLIEGVYLAEVEPADGAAPYFATVSRYSSNSPAGVSPETYNFAFALDGRAGTGDRQFMAISNETGVCHSQTNWVEVANVRDKRVTAILTFRGSDGSVLGGEAIRYVLEPKAQYHFNASALLSKNGIGSVEVKAADRNALIAQSLVYYHDCEKNQVQTAHASQGRIAGRDVQAGSLNTFLGMDNLLRLIATTSAEIAVAAEVATFDTGAGISSALFELNNYDTDSVQVTNNSVFYLQADRYGALTLRGKAAKSFIAQVLRIRRTDDGRMDFAMPTMVQ